MLVLQADCPIQPNLAHLGQQPVGGAKAGRPSEKHLNHAVLDALFASGQLVVLLVELHEWRRVAHQNVKVEIGVDLAHGRADALAHLDAGLLAARANDGQPLLKVDLPTQLQRLLVSARAEVEAVISAQTVADDAPEVEQCAEVFSGEAVEAQLKRGSLK